MVTLLVFGVILLLSCLLLISIPSIFNRKILNEKSLYDHRNLLAVVCFIVGVFLLLIYYYFEYMP